MQRLARLAVSGVALAAGFMLWHESPAGAADTASPRSNALGLHIFGSTGEGDGLDDFALKQMSGIEAVSGRVDCTDLKDFQVQVAAYPNDPDVQARNTSDYRLRLKFRCMFKRALGHHKSWRKEGRLQDLEFVLFFNGGLNTQKISTEAAAKFYQGVLDDGKYPIFMIWPTGFGQTYGDALLRTRNADPVNPREPQNWPTAVTQAASDLLIGIATLPKTLESSARYLDSGFENIPVETSGLAWRIRSGETIAAVNGSETRNVSYSDAVDEPAASNLARNVLAPVRPVAMTLSEVGVSAWDNMVRRSRTAVHNIDEYAEPSPEKIQQLKSVGDVDCEVRLANQGPRLKRCFPSGAGAFSRLFHWYSACARPESVPKGSDICPLDLKEDDKRILRSSRLTLIGHSMGAIVINELVMAYPDLPYANVVFMAGADNVRATSRSVVPMIERNRGCTHFYNLMLHPWNDANELTFEGIAPRGSLLEYIDQYLAGPRTVDERTVGKWTNVAATKHLFGRKGQKWMLFRIIDRDKVKDYTPLSHGDFKQDGFTRETSWNPARVAFAPKEGACEGKFFPPAE